MKKTIKLLSLFGVVVFLLLSSQEIKANTTTDTLAEFKDEVLEYDIKNFGLDVGNATIAFKGSVEIEGRKAVLIIFTAEALNFYDQEKIYLHPVTLRPLIIKRDLNIFGKEEKIDEEYLPDQGKIKIIKNTKDKTEDISIEKDGKIENIYGFIYRYRRDGKFKIGENFLIPLPTKDVNIKLIKETRIKAAGRKIEAYYMQSDPKQYRIWFENNDKKVPVRIDGSVGFGKTSMILK